MKVYFLSAAPAELTVNGVFFGITDNFERFAEIDISDNLFVKFTPQDALPVGVFLNQELLDAPPAFCEIYRLPTGVALYVRSFPPLDHTLRPIAQARENDLLVTVFQQGEVQVSIQTPDSFFVSTLPPSFVECEVIFHCGSVFIHGKNALAVYSKTGKRLFLENVLSFERTDNAFNATLPLSDGLRRIADCSYQLEEDGLTQTGFIVRQPQGRYPDELLAYAFFESILLGADYKRFLADELQPQAEKLLSFLGDFERVTLTDSPYTCGLVKKRAERVFDVIPMTIVAEDGKISDIQSASY